MSSDQTVYQGYLHDLITLIKDEAEGTMNKLNQIKQSSRKLKDDIIFQDGRLLAYQEVLTTMMHQLETFQIPLNEVGFEKVDQKFLLCDKN